MIGNVAQVVALISYGNTFLKTGESAEFFPANSSFQFCNNVDFRLITNGRFFVGGSVSTIADNPSTWFDYLSSSNCERLRFYYRRCNSVDRLADYDLSGLVGSDYRDWFIEAVYGKKSVLWRSFWDVTAPEAKNQKIWSVTYGTDGARVRQSCTAVKISDAVVILSDALKAAIEFAAKSALDGWNSTFVKALNVLSSDNPEDDHYHKDLFAEPLSMDKRRLFYAAAHAWVFGGMGSWDDNWFKSKEVQREFQRVTINLYDAVNNAYGAVVNS